MNRISLFKYTYLWHAKSNQGLLEMFPFLKLETALHDVKQEFPPFRSKFELKIQYGQSMADEES